LGGGGAREGDSEQACEKYFHDRPQALKRVIKTPA